MSGADFTALATSSARFGELLVGVMRQRQTANDATDSTDVTGSSEASRR